MADLAKHKGVEAPASGSESPEKGLFDSLRVALKGWSQSEWKTRRAAQQLAEQTGRRGTIREVPHASAALGIFTGVPPVRIGLLRHVCLTRVQLTGGMEPPVEGDSTETLRIARQTRRQVVRLLLTSSRGVSTDRLEEVLVDGNREIDAHIKSSLIRSALKMSLTKCRAHLGTQPGKTLAHELVADSFAALLGEFREVARAHYPTHMSSEPSDDEVTLLRNAIRARAVYAYEVRLSLGRGSSESAFENAIMRLRNPISAEMRDWYQPGAGRSSPIRFIQAARRSFAGIHIGIVQALHEQVLEMGERPTAQALQSFSEVLTSWGAAEGQVPSGSGAAPSSMTRNVFSVPGSGSHAMLREVVAPAIAWATRHYDSLSLRARNDVVRLCRAATESLAALTLHELSEFYSGSIGELLESPRRGDHRSDRGSRIKEFLGLNRPPPEPFLARYDWVDLRETTALDIARLFKQRDVKLPGGQRALAKLAAWGEKWSRRYNAHVNFANDAQVVLVSEFDNADGSVVPRELEHQFVALQERHRVHRGAQESGFVEPESIEWLRQRLKEHDGILLSVSSARMRVPITTPEPYGICVLTFSQRNPSDLMQSLLGLSSTFLSELPREVMDGASIETPVVLAELVVAGLGARDLRATFGEMPYQVLDDQAMFNVVSRFPYHPRVDILAICREGSVAMKAHARFGWVKTGAIYEDQNGTRFDIIYRSIRPAAILLGYRDLSSR